MALRCLTNWGMLLVYFLTVRWVSSQEETCDASSAEGCLTVNLETREIFSETVRQVVASRCESSGFQPERLSCGTCRLLEKHLKARVTSGSNHSLVGECLRCCQEEPTWELFSTARLTADASQQERDQDLHDFIKRKAPQFQRLEVEYSEGSTPSIELEKEDDPNRVLLVHVQDWKSDHIYQFLSKSLIDGGRLNISSAQDATTVAPGAWSAEIQSCSG